MINLMDTAIGERLKKATQLSDVVAWYDALDKKFLREIISLIQVDQLTREGVDEDGDVIGYYSLWTEILSGGRKKFGDHYTLNDTGDFYRSMFITVLSDSFVIDADPNKGDENLFFKYGEGIIGLTEENLELVTMEIRERYIKYARELLELD